MPTDAPLRLADREPLFSGKTRHCYVHPDDPDLMVKVLRADAQPAAIRASRKQAYKRHLPLWHFDVSLREWKAFQRLERRIGPAFAQMVPRIHGMTETDLGTGQVARFVRHADGTPGTPLPETLRTGHDPIATRAVAALLDFLRENRIPVSDLSPPNVVLTRGGEGEARAWLVDGFATVEFFPLTRISGHLAARRARSATRKFHRKIDALGLSDALALPAPTPSRAAPSGP